MSVSRRPIKDDRQLKKLLPIYRILLAAFTLTRLCVVRFYQLLFPALPSLRPRHQRSPATLASAIRLCGCCCVAASGLGGDHAPPHGLHQSAPHLRSHAPPDAPADAPPDRGRLKTTSLMFFPQPQRPQGGAGVGRRGTNIEAPPTSSRSAPKRTLGAPPEHLVYRCRFRASSVPPTPLNIEAG
jgi:hypothetical protein